MQPEASTAAETAAEPPDLGPLPEDPGPSAFTHTSTELMRELKLGWNLGNSLDVPDGETAWGNPKATPQLLVAVKKAGFHLVRIPVTWAPHTGPAPGFTIDPSWLARVREVAVYARAAGLHAVINLHHDGADGFKNVEWITLNDADGKVTPANNAAVQARFVAVWKQIAKSFSDFGEELLFESMNEIHDGYGPPRPEYFPIINALNQKFVDVVRASGENNSQRHLVVPGYNTNIEHTLKGFKPPKDPTKGRLILSVHYYDPYLFSLMGKVHTWGKSSPGRDDWGQEDFVVEQLDKLKKTYVDRGIPILMGEYGATKQSGFEDYRRYYLEYVTKAAVDRGILPVYWDNGGRGSSGEDNFAIINRETGAVLEPTVVEALLRAATSSYALEDIALPKPG